MWCIASTRLKGATIELSKEKIGKFAHEVPNIIPPGKARAAFARFQKQLKLDYEWVHFDLFQTFLSDFVGCGVPKPMWDDLVRHVKDDLIASMPAIVDLTSVDDPCHDEARVVASNAIVVANGDTSTPYDDLVKEELIQTLVSRDLSLQKRKAQNLKNLRLIKSLRQKCRRAEHRLVMLQQDLQQARVKDEFAIERKGTLRLTAKSMLSIAILRNACNVAACSFGISQRVDVSRFTVARCEIKAGACLQGSSKTFQQSIHEYFLESVCDRVCIHDIKPPPLNQKAIIIQCDATNSSVWQRRKLHSLKAHTASVVDIEGVKIYDDWDNIIAEQTRWADILPVENGTAIATLSTIEKQLESLDIMHWTQQQNWLTANRNSNILALYNINTDRGSDQVAAKQMVIEQTNACPDIVVIGTDCFCHAYSLMILASLALIDKELEENEFGFVKYYSTLAIIMNVWRELCRLVFQIWCKVLGDDSALKYATRSLPNVLLADGIPLLIVPGFRTN